MRARRIALDRLPALDQLGEIVVAAELLGELGQIREHDRLARRERDRLLQQLPRACRARRARASCAWRRRSATSSRRSAVARSGRSPAGAVPAPAPGPAGPNAASSSVRERVDRRRDIGRRAVLLGDAQPLARDRSAWRRPAASCAAVIERRLRAAEIARRPAARPTSSQ